VLFDTEFTVETWYRFTDVSVRRAHRNFCYRARIGICDPRIYLAASPSKSETAVSRLKSPLTLAIFLVATSVVMCGWLYFLGGVFWRLSLWTFGLA
jgi:hypothetical protein